MAIFQPGAPSLDRALSPPAGPARAIDSTEARIRPMRIASRAALAGDALGLGGRLGFRPGFNERRNPRLDVGAVRLQALADAADFLIGEYGRPAQRKGDCVES